MDDVLDRVAAWAHPRLERWGGWMLVAVAVAGLGFTAWCLYQDRLVRAGVVGAITVVEALLADLFFMAQREEI